MSGREKWAHHQDVAHKALPRGEPVRVGLPQEGEVETHARDEVLRLANVHPEA